MCFFCKIRIQDDNIASHVGEILEAWAKWKPNEPETASVAPAEDVDVRLARMLESQCLPTTSQKKYTAEEKRIREAILAQYSQMSDEDADDGRSGEEGAVMEKNSGLEKNTNVSNIVQLEKEKREKAKLDSQKKKEKDKEDR